MSNSNVILKGITGSDGVAIAPAYCLDVEQVAIAQTKIDQVDQEIARLQQAITTSLNQIKEISQIALKTLGEEKAIIFEAHQDILADQEISSAIIDLIKNEKLNSLAATEQVFNNYIQIFQNSSNSYLKERATDMKDIKTRLLLNLANKPIPDLYSIKQPCIIVANDLTPSQTAILNKEYIKGFVTKIGGKTSHSAILARTKAIPCILSLGDKIDQIKNGDLLAIDTSKSQVVLNPSDQHLWQEKIAHYEEMMKEYDQYRQLPTQTKDGHKVLVESNIGNADDALITKDYGSEGVGLFRSEFLYMHNSQWPTEQFQADNYQKALAFLKDQTVVIRTLDIGGDKKLSYYTFEHEDNPFLGYRAIRLCLDQPEIFKTQIRALLKASSSGKLAIMFPMVATIEEFKKAKEMVLVEKEQMFAQGIKVASNIQIGMMIEIPAAAVSAHLFAKYVDFFSIGTNDLIQYTLACDRMSKKVSYLYQPNHPSILRLVKNTIDAAHQYNKWVGMCGEMAADPLSVPLLLGLGLDAFSVSASSVIKDRYMINNLNYQDCQKLVEQAMQLETCQDINQLVANFLAKQKIKY